MQKVQDFPAHFLHSGKWLIFPVYLQLVIGVKGSYKDRKPVVAALRAIYRARNAEAGLKALEAFETGYWGRKYAAISQHWRCN